MPPTDRQLLLENATVPVAQGNCSQAHSNRSFLFEIVAGEMTPGAAEVVEKLRALAILEEDTSKRTSQLMPAPYSNSRGSDALSWPPEA